MNQVSKNFVVAVLLGLIAVAAVSAATDIRLRERVAITGSVVHLGDIADVVDADRQQARQLAALSLIPVPARGTQRFLRKREIEDLLAAHGVELKGLRIDGAAQVTIESTNADSLKTDVAPAREPRPLNRHAAILAGQTGAGSITGPNDVRSQEIQDELRSIVISYLETKNNGAATQIVSCEVADRHLELIDAATSPITCQGGASPWTGRQRLVVSFTTERGKIEIPVYAQIALESLPVVVAKKPIARGEQITAEHVEMRTVENSPAASGRRAAVDSIEQIVGMEARQAIPEGNVVYADQVQSPLLVKRGEIITVSSQGSGIRIRTTARASKDGAQGEMIQVESLETRERYEARVVGPREASVAILAVPPPIQAFPQVETARR